MLTADLFDKIMFRIIGAHYCYSMSEFNDSIWIVKISQHGLSYERNGKIRCFYVRKVQF